MEKLLGVHFVCTGNIFRSRMAESYLKSKSSKVQVSSSGTQASTQKKGPIMWLALRIIYRNNLLPFMKIECSETTQEDLKSADLVIFFGQKNYDLCKERFNFSKDYLVWNMEDFDESHLNGKPTDISEEVKYIEKSEETFRLIKEKIDDLINERGLN